MGSLIEELQRREAAARQEVDELRGESCVTVDEDVWVVGPDSAPLRVMHRVGAHRTSSQVSSVTQWPLTP